MARRQSYKLGKVFQSLFGWDLSRNICHAVQIAEDVLGNGRRPFVWLSWRCDASTERFREGKGDATMRGTLYEGLPTTLKQQISMRAAILSIRYPLSCPPPVGNKILPRISPRSFISWTKPDSSVFPPVIGAPPGLRPEGYTGSGNFSTVLNRL